MTAQERNILGDIKDKLDKVYTRVFEDNGTSIISEMRMIREELSGLKSPDNGEERRKGTLERMSWPKKFAIFAAIFAFLFRPELANLLHYVADVLQKLAQ